MIYIVIPFLIMIICSFIIIVKIKFKSNQLASTNLVNNQNNRNRQLITVLFVCDTLFFTLISPLLILNATGYMKDNTIPTTIGYIFAYSNHA